MPLCSLYKDSKEVLLQILQSEDQCNWRGTKVKAVNSLGGYISLFICILELNVLNVSTHGGRNMLQDGGGAGMNTELDVI